MKTSLNVFFLLLICPLLTINAQEWSPEQKEVIEYLNNYTKVSIRGNTDEIMSYFHVDFIAWEYSITAESTPFDRDATQKMMEDFGQTFKTISFEVQPLAILIHGNIAIAHLNFKETLRDADGVDHNMSGPWTATLLKQDKGWGFLCWTWMYL
jgi:ketosteroid isomerase-like protein